MTPKRLTEAIAEILKRGIAEGFRLPLYLATVDRYGSLYLAKYEEADGVLAATVLAENLGGAVLRLPLNMMLTDSAGNGFHALVGRESH